MRDFIEHATSLAELLTTRYCRPDGLLARTVNCESGGIVDDSLLADEIGDYCQYTIVLGARTDRRELCRWGEQQVLGLLDACQTPDGLIYPQGKPESFVSFFPTLRMGDTFWGLQAVYKETRNARIETGFRSFTERVLSSGTYRDVPAYGLLSAGGFYVTLPLAETMSSGYVAESLIEMGLSTGNQDYMTAARGILDAWLCGDGNRTGAFSRRGLHQRIPLLALALDLQFKARGRPGIHESILTKGDTFLLFAMLAEYKVSGDQEKRRLMENWVTHLVSERTTSNGRFYNQWDMRSGKGASVRLEENHSVIELLLDIAHFLDYEPALEAAARATLSWVDKTGKAGLIANNDGAGYAEIDPMLDLLVNMLKLAEISGDDFLREEAFEGISALLKSFSLPFGYAHRSDMESGVPLGPVIETKYLGLLIKGLLLFDHVENGGTIMNDPETHALATDR